MFPFPCKGRKVPKEDIDRLASNHEEADTRICTHVKNIDGNAKNIIIRASDTDIAVILLHHCWKFAATVWMDVDTSSKNDRRYVNVTAISSSTGPTLCGALPGFHAFTGSDYTSAVVKERFAHVQFLRKINWHRRHLPIWP